MDKDFRYTMPNGSEVEAFQVTDASLFQESESPDWMNSKMLFTKGGSDSTKTTHWLNVDEVETQIPPYGWVVRNQAGAISVVDYTAMEAAVKVVREVPVIPDIAKPLPEKALRLGAKMSKKSIEEVREEDVAQVEEANANRQAMIDSMHPDDAAAGGYVQSTELEPVAATEPKPASDLVHRETTSQDESDKGLLNEARGTFDLLRLGKADEAKDKLHDALISRANWCNCAPGQCDGSRDTWDCRQNSPLVQ